MATKSQLENALKDAMRAGDDVRKRTLRMVLTAIRLSEVEKGNPLDETAIVTVLHKEVKTRRETISEAEHAKRPDLKAEAEAEIAVLESFLPQSMTQGELDALARTVIEELGATTPREMGQVMKVLLPRVQGRAAGAQVSEIVRRLLGA